MSSDSLSIPDLIARGDLHAVFQPIVDFGKGEIVGYEGLIRGPVGTPYEMPTVLFARAAEQGQVAALEYAATHACMDAFSRLGLDAKLFLNFSADVLHQLATSTGGSFELFNQYGVRAKQIVVELTEQYTIGDPARFLAVVETLRTAGAQFALDDYGTAHSSMNLWVQLQPDIVKVDRFFIQDIARDALKFEAVRAMLHFARASGARIVAEGIENEADLVVVRDMGINFGQGFFLGRPSARPPRALSREMHGAIRAGHIAVFPEMIRQAGVPPSGGAALARMMVSAPALPREATNNDVLEVFNRLPELHAVAVVENDQPVALINRHLFMDRFALPYHRELFGKKACLQFANASPMVIERSTSVEQLAELLSGQDQRYLVDGFVITENDRYLGLGTGENLVRAVTEVRLQAARYANPLTFLPGNIPLSSHIGRLLGNGVDFHACYVDLNNFKPFNDQYGYWRGDDVLKFCAAVLADVCDRSRDFLGHVGGDDFLILFQSDDWRARVQQAIDAFNAGVLNFYAPEHQQAGGIHGEDRYGNPRFFRFVTMAVGCVAVKGGNSTCRSEDIASLAAVAKRRAKQATSGFALIDAQPDVPLPDSQHPAIAG